MLFRLQGRVNQEAIVPALNWPRGGGGGVWGQAISLDAPREIQTGATLAQLDRPTGQRGWAALVLPPGPHLLRLYTVNWGAAIGSGFFSDHAAASLFLDVPAGGTVVYAGTLHWEGRRKELLFEHQYEWKSPTLGTDDFAEAATLPVSPLHRCGPVPQRPAPFYGQPLNFSLPAAANLELQVTGASALHTPDWTSRGASLFTGAGQSGAGAAEPIDAFGNCGQAGAGLMVGYLLYLPVGASVGALAGAVHGAELRPRMEVLTRQVQEYGTLDRLRAALAGQLGPAATAPASEGYRLRVELLRIQLREVNGARNPFCLEMATRVTLTDLAKRTTPFDAYLTYSNSKATLAGKGTRPLSSEILLEPQSPSRPIADWCGASGTEIMARQLQEAVNLIATEAIRRTNTAADRAQ